MRRLPIVGVMGSGRSSHTERAEALGAWLGNQPVHLLTGGGDGVMAAVSGAFARVQERVGSVIGVLPGSGGEPHDGYPNPWVEIPIVTHLPFSGARGKQPLSRNHINVLSSAAIVALPGGLGTASEVELALDYGRPVVAFVGHRDDIPGLPTDVAVAGALDEVIQFLADQGIP